MICPVCGSELREDAKFCNVCGFEIGIEDQINIREIRQKITKFRLPNFVEEVEPTWRDCPLCGKPVVKSIGEYGEFCACATYPICKFACDEDELDELTNSPLPDCPICKDGKILPRKGRYGKFYGCSNYPKCNFTVPEDELDKLDSMEIKRCPNCGGYLLLKTGKNGKYYGCNKCRFTCPQEDIDDVETAPYDKCPECGGILVRRVSPNGEFISCSNYPNCYYSKSL